MIFIIIALVIILLYLFSLRGRIGYKKLENIKGFDYAHRGLHGNGVAENSLTAFRLAKQKGCGIEFDVHLLKDGNLAVMHDSVLMRTTGKDGVIEELTLCDLENYSLENTNDTIPTFEEVLSLFEDATPLIIELKVYKNNFAELLEKVCEVLENYNGAYCLESFDPRCVFWLKKNRPEIIRGQLCENYFKSKSKLNFIFKFCLTNSLLNFITKPDFVAYKFADRKCTISNFICQRLWKMQMVGWTIRSRKEHTTAIKEKWISIFEHFLP